MADYETCELGDVVLQCGITLRNATIAYRTYGELTAARNYAILMPTFFGGQHSDTELMMAPGRALDPAKYFVVVPNALGNGLSSSPSTTSPPFDGPGFPEVSLADSVRCQHRLLTECLGIDHLRLVVGFSMGAQQAFQWGALYPEMVDAIAPICGSAKTSQQNALLLQGARAALTTASDSWKDATSGRRRGGSARSAASTPAWCAARSYCRTPSCVGSTRAAGTSPGSEPTRRTTNSSTPRCVSCSEHDTVMTLAPPITGRLVRRA